MAFIHLTPFPSRFWGIWVALWGHEQDSSMENGIGPESTVMSVLGKEDQK